MGEYVCLFKVLAWDEVKEESVVEQGMIFASSFASAAEYLEKELYGDNLMEIQHLELFDSCPIFSAETWAAMQKELKD